MLRVDYAFDVSSGGSFFAQRANVKLQVRPDATLAAAVTLERRFDPAARGWYCADLHHHADQAEAVTPPADLARSQLAAGLSLLFVSDHDSMVNFDVLDTIAARRHVPLLRGMELSPSWGHFNAYPLEPGQRLAIDTSVASVDQIFAEARRLGATVVQANHPFIPYGYLASVAAGVAPGGFNPAFELLEINAAAPGDDMKVMHTLWSAWNDGHRYYVSGGTDTHSVWNNESGVLRAFAHVDGALDAAAFAQSLKEGHAYVTTGTTAVPFRDVRRCGQARAGQAVRIRSRRTVDCGTQAGRIDRRGIEFTEGGFQGRRRQPRHDLALLGQARTFDLVCVRRGRCPGPQGVYRPHLAGRARQDGNESMNVKAPHAKATLEPIHEAEIEAVIPMAREIWVAHYVPIIGQAQVDYMLGKRFTAESLRSFIGAHDRWFEVLKYEGERVGYCAYSLLPEPAELKLDQLYLHQKMRGKGLGGLMIRHIEARAHALGRTVLVLQVNKHNSESIAVYGKMGFSVREEAVFDIGGGFVMDDYIMEKRLVF